MYTSHHFYLVNCFFGYCSSSDYTHSVVEADSQYSKGVVDLGLKKVHHVVSRHTKLVYENPFHLQPAVPPTRKYVVCVLLQ